MAQVPAIFELDFPRQGFKTTQRILLLAGLLFAGLGTLFMIVFTNPNLGWKPAPPPRIVIVPFCGLFIAAGILLIYIALHTALERLRIAVTADELIVSRRGMLRTRSTRIERGQLKDIALTDREGSADAYHLCILRAILRDGSSRFLFQRYGKEETTRIYEALRAVLFAGTPAGDGVPASATVTQRGDELAIHLEPMAVGNVLGGIYTAAKAFFIIAPCVFAIVLVILFVATRPGDLARVIGPTVGTMAVLAIMGLAVAGMKWAQRIARREATITISAAQLTIEIMDAGRPAVIHRIDRGRLKDVRLAPSTIKINEVALPLLRITQEEAGPIDLFAGRDADELTWLEKKLRGGLGLDDSGAAAPAPA